MLEEYKLGHISNGEIIIADFGWRAFVENEFREGHQIRAESCWSDRDWRWFKSLKHGEKVPVSLLEPYIARYVKAISACSVMTVGSCDGNHQNRTKLYIRVEGPGSQAWHKLICEKCLDGRFRIKWTDDYMMARFHPRDRYSTYYELNCAAEFLYKNRIKIRQIKEAALADMSCSYFNHHTSEEIEAEFAGRAVELFDSTDFFL